MKILFYDTQNYDRESFDRTKEQFPEIEVEYLKTGLAARTASLAKGYDAVCAFVNSDVNCIILYIQISDFKNHLCLHNKTFKPDLSKYKEIRFI